MQVTRRAVLAGAGALAVRPAWAATPPRLELEPRRGEVQLGPEGTGPARIWGYGGAVPGPEIRVRQGGRVAATLVNGIDQPTTVHWHGIRIDNAMDGAGHLTQMPVEPGARFDYDFTVPDAGTYWYHPHFQSWEQVARGLYGPLIVEEAEPPEVDRDLVLILDDWRLTAEGGLDEESFGSGHDWSHAGRLGNWPTVNGLPQPEIPVKMGERLRLRLISAANATVMVPRLDGMRAWRIAVDGQPAPVVEQAGEFLLAPGQRVDFIADIVAEDARLMLAGRENFVMATFPAEGEMRREALGMPAPLPPNPLAEPADGPDALAAEIVMEGGAMAWLAEAEVGGMVEGVSGTLDGRALAGAGLFWALNGVAGMPEAPFLDLERGRTVKLSFENRTRFPHVMHLHGHHVREAETGLWRDSVLVMPDSRLETAFVADNPGDWMLHCHMLEHQAGGMATWFRVA